MYQHVIDSQEMNKSIVGQIIFSRKVKRIINKMVSWEECLRAEYKFSLLGPVEPSSDLTVWLECELERRDLALVLP